MLGRARVVAVWGNAPSADDIRKVDQERLRNNPLLIEPAGDDDLATADELLKTHGTAPVGGGLRQDVPRRSARAGRHRG